MNDNIRQLVDMSTGCPNISYNFGYFEYGMSNSRIDEKKLLSMSGNKKHELPSLKLT